MTYAHDLVMRGFQMQVGDQHHGHIEAGLDGVDFGTLLVQQEGSHIHRHLCVYRTGVFLHRLFLDDAQDVQGGGFDTTNEADAMAARTRHVAGFSQRRLQALTRQFQQAETRQLAHLNAGTVVLQHVTQTVFHVALVLRILHVDEVDDDQAAQVTQTQLTGDLFCRFQVGAEGGVFDVGALGGASGVHVHRY